jgi:hypothetical protein
MGSSAIKENGGRVQTAPGFTLAGILRVRRPRYPGCVARVTKPRGKGINAKPANAAPGPFGNRWVGHNVIRVYEYHLQEEMSQYHPGTVAELENY